MKFKRKFLTLFLGIFAVFGFALSSNHVEAQSYSFTINIDGSTRSISALELQINHIDPVLTISGGSFSYSAQSSASIEIDRPMVIEYYKWQEGMIFSEEVDTGHTSMSFTVYEDAAELSWNNSLLGQFGDFNYIIIKVAPDQKIPVISGQTTFVTDVDDAMPISYFMQYLSAYDETDGDVSDSLTVITDNYTANMRVLGNHTFTVQASDLSGNTTQAIINIRVVDIVAPVITGNTTTADIGYSKTFDIENFRKTLSVTDNYQTMTNADIVIDTDGYTSNKTKLGTYTITFKASDASGNIGTFSKKVRVIDDVAPTFSGPTTISTSNNTVLTESDIRNQLTANDFIDGNITNRIQLVEDNYTGKGNKVGSYTIIYSVTDNAGNTANHTVTIQRIDKIPPTIWVLEGTSIRTTPDTPISRDVIIDILEATGQIEINATTTFSFPLDEYSGNEETPGVYAMTLMARSTNGNESVHSFAIEVLDINDDGENLTREPSEWLKDNMFTIATIAIVGLGLIYIIRKRK